MNLRCEALSLAVNKKSICQNLTWCIKPGEIWGVLGKNGSGKTTLLHTLAKLNASYRGKIFLQNKNIRNFAPKIFAQQLGILLQEQHFTFAQTVNEYCVASRYPHLDFFKRLRVSDIDIIHNKLQALDLASFAEKKITQLSGGEQKRLRIAELLIQQPQIYLLDEPTNHLDLKYQKSVLCLFQKLAQENEVCCVMNLHDVNLAAHFCSHVLLLFQDGQVQIGLAKQLLREETLSLLYDVPIKQTPAFQSF